MTKRITAKKDYQGGYKLMFTGTSAVAGAYYPEHRAGWFYDNGNIVKFEAKALADAKIIVLNKGKTI